MRARLCLTTVALLALLSLGLAQSVWGASASRPGAPDRPLIWQSAAVNDTGLALWRTKGSTIPQTSIWDGVGFGSQQSTADVGEWRIITGAVSQTRDEYIVLGVDIDGNITGQMRSGGAWSPLPFNPLASVTESFWWSVDVAYEHGSGDALVVWNRGTGGATPLSCRKWNGTTWSPEIPVSTGSSDEAQHMHLAANPTSNEMLLVASTSTSQDQAMIWNGGAWDNRILFTGTGTEDDRTDIAPAYESQSGRALAFYGDDETNVYFYIWNGSKWSARDSVEAATGVTGRVRWTAAASDPQSNRIALAVLTTNNEIWVNVWNGSTWGVSEIITTSATGTTFPGAAVAFEGQSGEAVVAYGEAASVRYRTWNPAGGWSDEGDASNIGAAPNSITLSGSTTSDKIMLVSNDGSSDINFVLWDGSGWGSRMELEKESDEVKNQPFLFLWVPSRSLVHAPVLVVPVNPSVDENQNLNFAVLATDPDGDSVILSVENLPVNATFTDDFDNSGTFDFNPDFTQAGTYDVTFIASDGILADTVVVTITVNDVNTVPILAPIGPRTVDENQNLSFVVSAIDLDGDSLILLAENIPANGTFTDNCDRTGDFDFNPDYTQAGSYGVRFIASDGVQADTEIVTIIVNDVNRAPVLDPIGNKGTDEGKNLNFTVTASDPDGTIPALSAEDLPTNATFVDHGDGTGTFDFNPDYDQQGGFTVTFIASDGTLTDIESVNITINGVNRTPVLTPVVSQSVTEGHNLAFSVLATDPDGDSLVLSAEDCPANAVFIDHYDGTGSFDFEPACNQAGTYDIRFIAHDSELADTLVVSVTVDPFAVAGIDVTPATAMVEAGGAAAFTATAYAADLSCTVDLTASVIWTTTDPSGSVTSGGLYTAGSNLSPPDYYVRAAYGGLTDSARVRVISDGLLAYVRIQWPDGTDFGDTALTTDDDWIRPVCRGYDSGDNLIGDIAVTWSLIGADAIGTVDDGPVAETKLTLTGIGTGRLVATHSGSVADTSGLITCTAGAAAYIVISPDTDTVATDATIQFDTDTYDADGNPVADVPVDAWGVLGGIGSISESGLFAPDAPGVGRITAVAGAMADTTGSITVLAGTVQSITVLPDSAEISTDETVQYTVTAVDADGSPTSPGTITWSLTEPIGTINATGLFSPTAIGEARVVALSSLGPTDTTAHLKVTAGQLAALAVEPDSTDVTVGETRVFTVTGFDADGNEVEAGNITWTVVGDVGTIDVSGVLTATKAGTGRIAARNAANEVADTSRAVVVYPTDLTRIIVSPDTASATVGSSLGFVATGYTDDYTAVDAGKVAWKVLGGIGTIDEAGNFTATNRGTGRIAATRTVDGISDTSGVIVVDVLMAANIPLGNQFVHAGESTAPILAFTLENHFATVKGINGLTLHDISHGYGTPSQIRSAIDSVALYIDSDANGAVGPSDLRVAAVAPTSEIISLSFGTVTVSPFSQRQFVAVAHISDAPCDGDSLDVYLLPAVDISTSDRNTVGGADSLNSLGYDIIDGLVADQITLRGPTETTITSGGGFQHVLSLDMPRNGYREDTLRILALANAGTAIESDLDSVAVFLDDGDGVWDDADRSLFAGAMLFTGGQWEVSGAAVRLAQPVTVLHVAAVPSSFAGDGRTLEFGVPLHGVEMFSANDGPIDAPVPAVATVTIATSSAVEVDVVPIAAGTLLPGEQSKPILGLSLINNSGTAANLNRLRLRLAAVDPDGATQAQLDSQIDSLMLWLKHDADYVNIGAEDSLLAVSQLTEGVAAFDVRTLPIASNGAHIGLAVTVALSTTNAKNGNRIGLTLDAPTDLVFGDDVLVTGDFPLANTGSFVIDAFPAAAVTVHSLASRTLFSGQRNLPVLDFELPRNGYSGDHLKRLELENRGTSEGIGALGRVVLWADAADDGFTPGDVRVGDLIRHDGIWVIAGLAYPLVDPSTRFVITVDISETSFEGGTLQLAIPVGGATFTSGATGPDDEAVMDSEAHLIFPASRITAISIPQSHTAVAPGNAGNVLMTFALYNGYVDAGKTLGALTLTNQSRSRSSDSFTDHELGQLSLFADTNGNRVLDNDLLLASGNLSDNSLRLSGLSVSLRPESLSYFFVTADIALDAIDRDSLAVCIGGYSDLEFSEAVNINGDIPITSGGMLIVDGSVAAQYRQIADPPSVLSPGDTGVVLLALAPAVNGNLEDTLQSVAVTDIAADESSVITSLALWRDTDGDGSLGALDEKLGVFTAASDRWVIDGLSLAIAHPAPGLLVAGTIAADAEPGTTTRLAVPVLGFQYTSDNDGPRDQSLLSSAASIVSTAALRVGMPDLRSTYTVGQAIAMPVAVTNVSLTAISDVVANVVTVSGDTCVVLDSAETDGLAIAPGETAVFRYYYTATRPGSVGWSLQAASHVTSDSSAVLMMPAIGIQSRPDYATVRLINSMPPSVTRGQANVFPMTIAIGHPDTAATAAPLRLDRLVVHAVDAAAQDVPFNSVASRLALATGLPGLTVVDDVPSDASVTLVFPQPLQVAPGRQRLLSLLIDIPDDAALIDFHLGLSGPGSVPLTDANTLEPVLLAPGTVFPMNTAGCHIHEAAQQLAVSSRSLAGSTMNYGQRDVAVLQLNLRHPGEVGSSRIQLSSVVCELVDDGGHTLAPRGLLDAVQIRRGNLILGTTVNIPADSQRVHVPLSSPLVLNANESDSVRVLVSLRNESSAAGFSLVIRDSTAIAVRDVSSGMLLETVSDPSALPLGAVFPMLSDFAGLRRPASGIEVCLGSTVPTSLVGGQDSVVLMTMTCTYPAPEDHSAVTIRSLRVAVQDSADVRLDPRALLDRIGYRLAGGVSTYQSFLSLDQGSAVFEFGVNGIRLDPGATQTIELIGDVEGDAPYDHFVLAVYDIESVSITDVSDSTHGPEILPPLGCDGWLPAYSPVVSLFLPAGEPIFRPSAGHVAVASGGTEDVSIFTTAIDYNPPTRQGNVQLRSVRAGLRVRNGAGDAAQSADVVFDRLRLLVDNEVYGECETLPSDVVTFQLGGACVLRHGTYHTLSIIGDVKADAPAGNYFLHFENASFVDMIDEQLGTTILPALDGAAYPFAGQDLSITGADLEKSFSNYPNPFNPARGEITTIAYVLGEDASVDIEIFTITGQRVITIADDALRAAGAHQVDTWTGTNDASLMVMPGTYFCRITARYASGSVEQFRRKVAVVR